jgi:DNA-binding transcriptional regulator YiaG
MTIKAYMLWTAHGKTWTIESMPRHIKTSKTAKIFGEQLKRRRVELGLTQEEFAYRSGIDISFISRCERGITQPSIGMLVQMAIILQTSGSKIMDDLERKLVSK